MNDKTNTITANTDIVKSPYYYLSKYRAVLMGFAILWVVWFHSSVNIDFLPFGNGIFSYLKLLGYCGVDLFFLISGMGIYTSLEKNDISRYIKNRVSRILPVWWTYLLAYVLIGHFVIHAVILKSEILGFATFTGFWLDMSNHGNWYIHTIMLLYLISPVFHALIKNSKNKLWMCVILVLISLVISFAYLGNSKLIALSRVPLYIIGMYISSALRDRAIQKKHWIGILIACVCGFVALLACYKYLHDYIRSYGLLWYPFIIIAPTFSLLLAKVFDMLQRILRPLLSALTVCGKSSLEILLISDYLFANHEKMQIFFFSDRITAILIVVISIALGIASHYCIDFITKQIKQKRKKVQKAES